VSHGDKDPYMGYKDLINEGYDILIANYEPGPPNAKSPTMISNQFTLAKSTKAGPFKPIPVGLRINLGHGAAAFVVAANGVVRGETKMTGLSPFSSDMENFNTFLMATLVQGLRPVLNMPPIR